MGPKQDRPKAAMRQNNRAVGRIKRSARGFCFEGFGWNRKKVEWESRPKGRSLNTNKKVNETKGRCVGQRHADPGKVPQHTDWVAR